ncbi:hypothetical protein FACS1894176_10590 [Bacteroidia bacterium]|nr:hypothetical protein FACS1894176_10590 [Bacteroidia bacterium]
MEMEILEYPSYLEGDLLTNKIKEIVGNFLNNNPYSDTIMFRM